MPFFVDGQDPRDFGQPPAEPAAPDPFAQPAPGAEWAAALRLQNPIVSAYSGFHASAAPADPDWNPLSVIRGTPYEQYYLRDFLGDRNREDTTARMAAIASEQKNRETLEGAGWAGTVASVASGFTDPFMYLPVVGEAARGVSIARDVATTAGRMALTGALSAGASEAALAASQQTRSPAEAIGNIASATLLMGLLGSAGAMLTRGESAGAARALDAMRSDLGHAPADLAAEVNPAVGLPADAGAAASDTRTLKLKNYGVPDWLKSTPYAGPAAEAIGGVFNKFSPTLRVFSSESVVAKRAMADLAETPLVFEDNAAGVPTSFGAPPLDRLIKVQSRQLRMAANDALEKAFVDYRYGAQPPPMPIMAAGLADVRGLAPSMMSFGDFKTAVHEALYSGDVHPIPQVQRAAQDLRSQVFDPVAKVAQATLGPDKRPMLAEDLKPPPGDQSYAPRVWNKEAIAARRNEVHGVFTDWLERQQTQKAGIQEALRDLSSRHDALVDQVGKLDRRAEVLAGRRAETDARLKERASETNRATDRADTLEERNAKLDARIEELDQFLAESKSAVTARDADPVDLEQYDALKRQLETLKRARARNDIRAGEADIPVVANQDRFLDLADRSSNQQIMQSLLERARGNAENDRLALRQQMEEQLGKWEGKSAEEARKAIAARDEADRVRGLKVSAGIYQGKGERLGGADAAVDAAVARILKSDRTLSRQELGSVSDEIIDRLLGSPDGRLSYDAAPAVGPPAFGSGQQLRGSLKSREFAIPTAMVKDFVEKDPQHLVSSYLRSVLTDVMLTQRFGDVEMRDVFRKLNEEYAGRAKDLTAEKDLSALEKERQGMIRDLAATRDRVRGVYGWSPDPRMRNAARIGNVARNWNVIADLGTSVANRLGDAGANAVFRHGFLNVFRDGWTPMFKALVGQRELASAYRAQAKAMAVGVDGMMGHMSHDFGDVLDDYRPGSKFERGLAWAADRSMLVNLHGPWTDWTKTFAGGVASAELLRTAERVVAGSASAKDIERLAAASIDRHMAARIWKEFDGGGGDRIDGVPVPNTRDWKDMSARRAFEAAIGREADIAVITPGLEKPLWMSGPIAGLVGQFKSFVAGAWERLLIANLQQRDARTLQGLITAVATGMLSYRLYTWLSGREASSNPADWVKEGIHRSAVLAWFSEANALQAKFTGGATDAYRAIGATSPLSRHDHSQLAELLGPTYSRLEGLTGAAGDAVRAVIPGDKPAHVWTAQDTHKLREVMFLQNLMGVRILFDKAEDGINSAMGVPHADRSGKVWVK